MRRTNKLKHQLKRHATRKIDKKPALEGDDSKVISTGSTLLDLAISGGRIHGGGIPSGILIEIFGPSSSGKTVTLCELAGNVQSQGGKVMFKDPEARLNKKFAVLFGMNPDEIEYDTPDTVPEVFAPIRSWNPKPVDSVHGIFTDSLAALSTDMELKDKDKMGARRAKEFSEELRKTCRILTKKNFIIVASNQIRQKIGATSFEPKTYSPGGEAIGFYSSLRLQLRPNKKIKTTKKLYGKERKKIVGVRTMFKVVKSSVWEPYHEAPVSIIFDYGIDNIRENLQFVKDYSNNSIYTINGENLDKSKMKSIRIIEREGREKELEEQVIQLWQEVEEKFKTRRKPKVR